MKWAAEGRERNPLEGFSRTKTTPSCRPQRVHAESARIRPDSIRSAHRVPKAISPLKFGLDRVCDSGRGQTFHPLVSQLQGLCFALRLCTFGSRLASKLNYHQSEQVCANGRFSRQSERPRSVIAILRQFAHRLRVIVLEQ